MVAPKSPHQTAIQQATCAAILAASFAAPLAGNTNSVSQSGSVASIVAMNCVALQTSVLQAIRQYCSSSWRQAGIPEHEWEDCTQDTLVELMTRLDADGMATAIQSPDTPERRELMRCVWCITQRWRRSVPRAPLSLDAVVDDVPMQPAATADFDLELLDSVMQELSSTQQQILHRVRQGDSVAEIAASLELPAARVSDQKYKAVRKLQRLLAA